MRTALSVGVVTALFSALPSWSFAQYNMRDYWITPPNRYGTWQTILWTNPADPNLETCKAGPGTAPHSFWQGTLMGKQVALQAGKFTDPPPENQAYDIFEMSPSGAILYWGTFRGNLPNDDTSHPFDTPVTWMNASMTVYPDPNATVSGRMSQHELTNGLRGETAAGQCEYTVQVLDHFDFWTSTIDPAGTVWPDVLYVVYTSLCAGQTEQIKEEYWLAKGTGTIAFKTSNRGEPSCIEKQYAIKPAGSDALGLLTYTPALPLVPWYDPFEWQTHVKNGFFQHTLRDVGGSDRAPLSDYAYAWHGWSGTPGAGTADTQDVMLAIAGRTGQGDYYAALRVQPSPGWDLAISDPIPVLPNTVYRLSGWLYRDVGGDNDVYLDMDDIAGDTNIKMSSVEWEHVSGDICVGSATSIQVRCVRDTLNTANAGCDGVTLQRVDGYTLTTNVVCGGGGTQGSGNTQPGCYLGRSDGVCQMSEKYVVLNPDGTYTRKTTCPEDCPSCGSSGGDYCSQTANSCPIGYPYVTSTFDCPSCCHSCTSTGCPAGSCGWRTDNCGVSIWCGSCLPSCGALGGNYCSQVGSCPSGYGSLGQSSDCIACCKSLPSCGVLGGNYCSQITSCPSGYSSLGQSGDCKTCCKGLPSCGTLGGNYCSQTASCPAYYTSLGQSSDCVRCCSCTPRGCPSGSCGWQSNDCGGSIWCGTCLQSCGQTGGDYCSQGGSCPAGYNSLGRSTDCQTCCQRGPSCGAAGGNYCSQNGSCPAGYNDLGRTWDCNHCCSG